MIALSTLHTNPIPVLLAAGDPALSYFVRRDLLGEACGPVEQLWELPEVLRLAQKQQSNGAWHYPGKSINPASGGNYFLLETYRQLRVLVEMYGLDRRHPCLQRAAEYVFSCQTNEGDVRGILGNQYMPYYHGAILELLVKAGYADDPRSLKGLEWLLALRQADGGWLVPAQSVPAKHKTNQFWNGPALLPDRNLPSSHLATGMALRACAAHPQVRQHAGALEAARWLKSRFFQAEHYNDRKAPAYWLKFQYPFWWTSLLTALDTLDRMGFAASDADIQGGLAWFYDHQAADGLWGSGYENGKRTAREHFWVGFAIARLVKSYSSRAVQET